MYIININNLNMTTATMTTSATTFLPSTATFIPGTTTINLSGMATAIAFGPINISTPLNMTNTTNINAWNQFNNTIGINPQNWRDDSIERNYIIQLLEVLPYLKIKAKNNIVRSTTTLKYTDMCCALYRLGKRYAMHVSNDVSRPINLKEFFKYVNDLTLHDDFEIKILQTKKLLHSKINAEGFYQIVRDHSLLTNIPDFHGWWYI